jgi:hypothetical protein
VRAVAAQRQGLELLKKASQLRRSQRMKGFHLRNAL